MDLPIKVKRRLRRFLSGERGTQMIELAIALPFMLLMFAGTAEIGRLYYQYTSLAKATQIGARYLSTSNDVSVDEAKNLMVCGSLTACGGATIVSGFGTGNIAVTPPATGMVPVKYVTVTVTGFNYQPLVFDLAAMTGNSGFSSISLSPSTRMRYMP